MRSVSNSKLLTFPVCLSLAFTPLLASADDIDIFLGSSGGDSVAPNVMFLIDNSPNWNRASQHWPDNGGVQGQAELAAIGSALDTLPTDVAANIGLALLTSTPDAPYDGGYIRFGARNISRTANKTAFTNIRNYIVANMNKEQISGMSHKDESAALYELYKYYSGLAPYAGAPNSSPNTINYNVDLYGATGAGNSTPFGQGLTSGFALPSYPGTYQSPEDDCNKNYVIYIANNANNSGKIGQQSYESGVAGAGPALPLLAGKDNLWIDEWARFLYQHGIITYVLDAYNAQQNPDYSAYLRNAAKVGGGHYYQVGSQADILKALTEILTEIQSVNSAFASASLPVNATNRSQNENQVFIGVFRPDPNAKPRWMGNMKQYQLITSGSEIILGDDSSPARAAVNNTTGFIDDCAVSFWTTDTTSVSPPAASPSPYWADVPENPSPASVCPALTLGTRSRFSDSPDGAAVEKGGVAEVVRKGNDPTTTTPTWNVNRTVYTLTSGATPTRTTFDSTSSGLSPTLVGWVKGTDNDASTTAPSPEKISNSPSNTRPSIHGDVIHSRPLPVNYGGTTGVTVYYGANDGLLRAIDASSGRERWSFIAPENFSMLQRLYDNSPMVQYPALSRSITPTPQSKNYGFDGSVGLFQNADNTKVWIYPAMRRGGRMLYGFDVTSPGDPQFKWKVGCPNLADDTGCTSNDVTGIGQTWSMPNVAFLKGYSSDTPVVVVGGGYDTCEDQDSTSPTCPSPPKGAAVYVIDADTGAVIKSFATTRSVAADVSLVDANNDGSVDYGYAADTGGNIYRIDFSDTARTPLTSSNWSMHRVAYTTGGYRKFLFGPALLPTSGRVYVAIGSGDREHPLRSQYPYSNVTNRFYVYLDDLSSTTTTPATNLDDAGVGSPMRDYRTSTCATESLLPSSSFKGWFMNLNQNGQGEQTVTSPLILGGLVAFSTNRPIPHDSGSCQTALGEARGYLVNLLNASGAVGVTGACGGSTSGVFAGGGLPPSPVMAVTSVGGKTKTVAIGVVQKSGGASSPIEAQKVTPAIKAKRKIIYWKSSGDTD